MRYSWQVQGIADSQYDKPVAMMFQEIYMAMIFLVCWEKSWFLETWSKTLKQRASPAVVFYRNFKTEVKVRICSEPPEEPGKEIQRKPKGGRGGQIPLHSYQKTEVWDTQKLWRWHAIMSSFPGDRKASWGSRPVKDWASVLSPTSFSTQAGTDNLLMQELSQRMMCSALSNWATKKQNSSCNISFFDSHSRSLYWSWLRNCCTFRS